MFARRQTSLSPEELRRLSSIELMMLMQLAMAAGEMEQSGALAREISRRKLTVQLRSTDAAQEWDNRQAMGGGSSNGADAFSSPFMEVEKERWMGGRSAVGGPQQRWSEDRF